VEHGVAAERSIGFVGGLSPDVRGQLAEDHGATSGLKVVVLGEGGNFLPTRPDPISVHKTRSISWLAQFLCQIITALGWEDEFRCEDVENLADFKALIVEVSAIDPDFHAFRWGPRGSGHRKPAPTWRALVRRR
jgi:hypothetical protein